MKLQTLLPVYSLVLAGLVIPAFAEDMVPVPVELPPVSLVGTETPIPDTFHFEDRDTVNTLAEEANRPQVPADAENLAAGKAVTTSDGLISDEYLSYPEDGETKYLLTDGLNDSAEFNEMVLIGEKQWVQIDLEAPADIYAVWLAHSHRAERVFIDVVVQLSDDPEFKEGVTTIFNNDSEDNLGFGAGKDPQYLDTNSGRFIAVPNAPVSAQYVRFYSSGNSFEADKNFYIEAEVWGTPAE